MAEGHKSIAATQRRPSASFAADVVVDPPKNLKRTLTQKYDMHAMRALEKLEEEAREEISKLVGVDEDDLPDDFDVLSIYHVDSDERLEALEDVFKSLKTPALSEILRKVNDKMLDIEREAVIHAAALAASAGAEGKK